MKLTYRGIEVVILKDMRFELGLLSKYRNQLYGIAAIMIICVHMCQFIKIDSYSSRTIFSIFQYGSLGVPIFGVLGGRLILFIAQ